VGGSYRLRILSTIIEAAIRQTIELQRVIDADIDAAGGWPLGWLARRSNLRLLSSCEP
jgi:hypothetical protein